ncbi:MAG: hypothetical protein KC940_24735 [Candidatus Omnitrophica bacterium]|nr:hypothetical protein [Candidatus Omnitrophota bacterium]MCA9437951.1 hypothetical protein [Candidatus Omnitrophota bacterium]MCB9770856.1 hypothetical protein [Candidatus Omnitrophota bacterium]
MTLPEYQTTKLDGDLCQIVFDPPVTKAALGVPFSFLVMQREGTEIDATRFGRVIEVRCDPSHWVAFLETRGEEPESIAEFKESVGYVEPEPVEEPAEAVAEAEESKSS